jgi:hypothetical protein
LGLYLLAPPAFPAAPRSDEVTLVSTNQDITLDGILSEGEWQDSGTVPDLVQQDPQPGAPTPYTTRVRFLRHEHWLYVAIEASFPAGEGVRVNSYAHDSDLTGDDAVTIVLDTFGDGRTGYLFRFNAAGARQDGLVTPGADEPAYEWDGQWDVATRITDTGWVAEVAIDLRALRFGSLAPYWGLNVERFVAAHRLTLRWQGITADAQLTDLRRAGHLVGITTIQTGLGLEIAPYAVARSEFPAEGHRSSSHDIGGELSYAVTPELGAILSVNTDFAETEVDDQRINLTRFPLLFPEKRRLFLEGSNQFAFASGLAQTFVPFLSRRIGLVDGAVVPIDLAAKVIGRVGAWSVGAVDAETVSVASIRSNLFAGRVAYDWDSHLRLGALLTSGDPRAQYPNTLFAWDAVWRTSHWDGDKNVAASAWSARSVETSQAGQRTGWGARLAYPNDLWNLFAQFDEFGDALDPALGFLPRPATRQYAAYAAYSPRPQLPELAAIRQLHLEVSPVVVTDLTGRTESWLVFCAPVNVNFANGDHFQLIYQPEFERFAMPFEIAPGVTIPVGDDRYSRYAAQYESSSSRPWAVNVTADTGSFYDGRLTSLQPDVSVAVHGGHLKLQVGGELDFGALREGSFTLRLLRLRAIYAPNAHLAIATLVQYDSVSGTAGFNTRMSWTIAPGRELFVVWNRRYLQPMQGGFGDLQRDAGEILFKIRWDLHI